MDKSKFTERPGDSEGFTEEMVSVSDTITLGSDRGVYHGLRRGDHTPDGVSPWIGKSHTAKLGAPVSIDDRSPDVVKVPVHRLPTLVEDTPRPYHQASQGRKAAI